MKEHRKTSDLGDDTISLMKATVSKLNELPYNHQNDYRIKTTNNDQNFGS